MTTVALVEIHSWHSFLPLVSGYLQSYARQDEVVAQKYEFEILSRHTSDGRVALVAELAELDCDIYAFSCYIWNGKLVREVLEDLVRLRPDAQYLLGGPQVMNHGEDYIPPGAENVAVCNGEGEITFLEYLRELAGDSPDLGKVPGLSFRRDGRVTTTLPAARIKELTEVPSPFVANLFTDSTYHVAVLETNRGCPFRCGFCYWGAATNDKVHRFEMDRVKADIEWIAKNNIYAVMIADANWGLSARDVELTEYIVECKEKYGFPYWVTIQSAKNSPERVSKIVDILLRGGLITRQPISLQSVSDEALTLIERKNIKRETYSELQRDLRARNIPSFIELIWPLPGETLGSYVDGIVQLCRTGADMINVYPQLLLHNTPIYEQRELFGVHTERVPNPVGEAELVVRTKWVNREQYDEGVWFWYALLSVYDSRGLYFVSSYLDRKGIMSFDELFWAVVAFYREHQDYELARYIKRSVETLDHYEYSNGGMVAHQIQHSHRQEADRLMHEFASAQPWWSDPTVRALFELDMVARPYPYIEPVQEPGVPLKEMNIFELGEHHVTVDLPPHLVAELVERQLLADPSAHRVRLDFTGKNKQVCADENDSLANGLYCANLLEQMLDMLPEYQVCDTALTGDAR
ncbi:B12-binding domain-containing radical SAM protein [Crossiella sp. NPDC003009]